MSNYKLSETPRHKQNEHTVDLAHGKDVKAVCTAITEEFDEWLLAKRNAMEASRISFLKEAQDIARNNIRTPSNTLVSYSIACGRSKKCS